jgi:hypothetical protein
MRAILPLAIVLLLPFAGALPSPVGEPAGDELVTLPPLLMRADPPAIMPPGSCHAPAIDILAMDVARIDGSLVVSLAVDEIASDAFSCPDLADSIGEPSYGVEFYSGLTTIGPTGDLQLMLTDSGDWMRCWGYVPGFFFPVACDYAIEGNTMTWTLAQSSVDGLDIDGRAIGRAEAYVGDGPLYVQDTAEG